MLVSDYRCKKCGEKFQVRVNPFFGSTEEMKPVCPRCKSPDVETFLPSQSSSSGSGEPSSGASSGRSG